MSTLEQQIAKGDENWPYYANCLGMDTNIFFPERGQAYLVEPLIKEICKDCVVKEECFKDGLLQEVQVGYYGGVSANQRMLYKRKHGLGPRMEKK